MKYLPLLLILLFMPVVAHASDPSRIYPILIGVPLLALSITMVILCLFNTHIARIASVILLVFQILVYLWADEVDALDTIGTWIYTSGVINILAVLMAFQKYLR